MEASLESSESESGLDCLERSLTGVRGAGRLKWVAFEVGEFLGGFGMFSDGLGVKVVKLSR
jgi:hypothetical protein